MAPLPRGMPAVRGKLREEPPLPGPGAQQDDHCRQLAPLVHLPARGERRRACEGAVRDRAYANSASLWPVALLAGWCVVGTRLPDALFLAQNAVPISTFIDDMGDQDLLSLLECLDVLADCDDVRNGIAGMGIQPFPDDFM